MFNALTIARKELATYFVSPVAYVVTAFFLVVAGFFFYFLLYFSREASMRELFFNVAIVLLFVGPGLTMRLLAEEQRMGTIELLLTSPVRDWEVVMGKFIASLVFYAFMLVLTVLYPLILIRYGNPDIGPILSGYLGMFLLGATFLAAGLFTSSLTQNQVVAFFIAFAILLILWLADAAGSAIGGPFGDVLNYLSIASHFDDFTKGVIDTSHLIYYLSLIVTFLFLATRVVETRRWR
jgi:ABC-2 type transport system permease protein